VRGAAMVFAHETGRWIGMIFLRAVFYHYQLVLLTFQ
jgi:hypothetical protein